MVQVLEEPPSEETTAVIALPRVLKERVGFSREEYADESKSVMVVPLESLNDALTVAPEDAVTDYEEAFKTSLGAETSTGISIGELSIPVTLIV